MDDLCDMMTMDGIGTFPSHTGCSRGFKGCDRMEMLCQLFGGRLEARGGKFRRHREKTIIYAFPCAP